MSSFYLKYLKYKNKYLSLKDLQGGSHKGEEVFFQHDNTIKQGKIVEDISPNYIVELVENGNITRKSISKVSNKLEYKLVNISSIIDLNKNIDYATDNFVVYYHGQSCNDGITSAWVTCAYLLKRGVNIDKIKFIDLNASKEIHERWTRFDDKKSVILFVDIAPSLHVYEKLKTNNKRIIVIDHHITNLLIYYPLLKLGADIIFDMNTSGAGLTWKTFFKGEPMPPFIELVVKRDIFRQVEGDNADAFYEIYHELLWDVPAPKTKAEINEMSVIKSAVFDGIQSRIDAKELPENFLELEPAVKPVVSKEKVKDDNKRKLIEKFQLIDKIHTDKEFFIKCIQDGNKITDKSIKEYLTEAYKYITNNNVYLFKNEDDNKTYRVCLIYNFKGDANSLANVLCSYNFCHFAINWYYKDEFAIKNEKNIVCSLRAWYKFDVSKLAEKYGGGGHANASGGVFINQHPITFFKLKKIHRLI